MPMPRLFLVIPLALAACHPQASVERTSGNTDRLLDAIAANTSEFDGQDSEADPLATPTLGQQMDAGRRPPR